jgi:hypothetical protein
VRHEQVFRRVVAKELVFALLLPLPDAALDLRLDGRLKSRKDVAAIAERARP